MSGGVLTGRIGEKRQRFVIGKAAELQAQEHGILFVRINDDILTDHAGWVVVQIGPFETEERLP